MANRFLSNLRINDAYTLPASDGTNGQFIATDGAGNLSFQSAGATGATVIYKDLFTGNGSTVQFTLANSVDNEIKTQVYFDGVYQSKDNYTVSGSTITFSTAPPSGTAIEVITFNTVVAGDYNQKLNFYGKAVGTITKGDAVMFAGAQGDHFLVAKATQSALEANHEYFLGLAAQDFANNEYGYVTQFGRLEAMDTSDYTTGDILWFDSEGTTAGAVTTTEPSPPNTKIQIAAVVRVHQNEGVIFIRPTIFHELNETTDVSISGVADKDLLAWNSTAGVWENTNTLGDITTGNITTSGTVDGVDVSSFKSAYDSHNHDDRYYTELEIDGLLANKNNWDTAYSWGDHSLEGYLTSFTETDPIYTASSWYTTTNNSSNWDTAYGWGNHASVGYLTSFTETDPVFSASPSAGITSTQITNWDTAYGWGNHASAGYLTSFTETDPTVPSHVKSITTTNISNWDTAYGWGNHASVGYLTSYTETDTLATVTARGASTSTFSSFNGGLTATKINKESYGIQIKGAYYGSPRLQLYDLSLDSNAFVGLGVDMSGGAYEMNAYFPRYNGYGRFSIGSWAGDFGTGQYVSGYNEKMYITESAAGFNVPLSINGTISATGYNNSNWDTAYGWGNHASAGYQLASTAITTSNIGSQSVSYATNAGSADTLDGIDSSNFFRTDGTYPNTDMDTTVEGYWHVASNASNLPVAQYGHRWDYDHLNNGQWVFQMYSPTGGDVDFWFRQKRDFVTTSWQKVITSANIGSYALTSLPSHNHDDRYLVKGGGWNGTNMPGSRWGGYAANGGEITFQQDNPGVSQMSVLVDGNFYAGENNGFWSLYNNNDYNQKAGFYTDTAGVLYLNAPNQIRINTNGYSDRLALNFDQIWTPNNGSLHLQYSSSGNIDMNYGGGYTFSRTSLRAPIFYDYDDSNYYIDPNSTSKLDAIVDTNGAGYVSRYHSGSDFTAGTLVTTNIPSGATNGASFIIEVTGKSYNSTPPFSFMAQGYLYNNGIINTSGVNNGDLRLTYIKVMNLSGNLAFWWPRVSYWNSFEVRVRDAGGSSKNRVTGVGDSSEPTSATKVTQINLAKSTLYDSNLNAGDLYAQTYYDANNTGYYVNPADISVLGFASFEGDGNSYNTRTTTGVSIGRYAGEYSYIELGASAAAGSWIDFSKADGQDYAGRIRYWNSDERFVFDTAGADRAYLHSSYFTHNSSLRAPIFYDSNDTGYYVDPNSNSKIISAHIGNTGTFNAGSTYALQLSHNNRHLLALNYNNSANYPWLVNDTWEGGAALIVHFNGVGDRFFVNSGGHMQADGSARSPIFYDSNDTSYYIDPNSSGLSSRLNGNLEVYARSAAWAEGLRIRVPATNNWGGIRFTRDRPNYDGNWALGFKGSGDTTDDLVFWANNGGSEGDKARIDKAGNFTAVTSSRSPIFYDSNDTGYYIDPASTSNLNGLNVGGSSVITSGNIGSQSVSYAANAGTLDTLDSTEFARGKAGFQVLSFDDIKQPGLYQYDDIATGGGTAPPDSLPFNFRTIEIGSGGRYSQVAFGYGTDSMYFRRHQDTTWHGWRTVIHDGNISSYALTSLPSHNHDDRYLVKGGGWNGTNMPGSRWGGYSANGGEITFQQDNPSIAQMSVLVDGNFYAGENNGFWSLYNNNDYNQKAGFYTDTAGVLYLNAPNQIRINTNGYSDRLALNFDQIWTPNNGDLHLQYSSSGNIDMNYGGGYTFSRTSLRAPIFYDYNDTGYYADPAGTSSFNGLVIRGDTNASGTQNQIGFWAIADGIPNTTSAIGFKQVTGIWADHGATSGGYNTYFSMDTINRGWVFRRVTAGSSDYTGVNVASISNTGIAQFDGSVRSPIFYDSNDTSYYMDPNGTSVIRDVTISGKLQNNPGEGYWRNQSTYIYQAPNVLYYYIKVANLSSSNSNGILEYYNKRDYNYPGMTHGTVTVSTYAASSMSVQHDSLSSDGQVEAQVFIDNNRDIWMRFSGSAWSSYFRWRLVYNSGVSELDGSTVQTSQPANSALIYPGDSKRFAWGDVASITHSYASPNIANVYTGRTAMYSPIFYDSNDTSYYVEANGDSRMYRINAPFGYYSASNPWGTADSAFFPNGITTAGGTNWVYGNTLIGNAPSNGQGVEIQSNGSFFFRVNNSSGTWGYSGTFVDRTSAANNYVPFSFENEYGNHSWGVVARFHIQQAGADRPSIQFSSASSNERWSLGYVYPDDNFRITQNHAYRPDGSGVSDGWGTERLLINTSGNVIASVDMRAPIFYDSNNTAYYVDPASGSYLNGPVGISTAPESGVGVKIQGGSNGGLAMKILGGSYASSMAIETPTYGSGIAFKHTGSFNSNFASFTYGTINVGSITVTSVSTSYNTSSDYRLKENIVPMNGALERVSLLKPSRFNFIGDDKVVDGFLAHEAAEVVPESVTGEKDAIGWDGNPEYQGIDQSKLVPLLVGAIQELKAEVEALKQQLNGIN